MMSQRRGRWATAVFAIAAGCGIDTAAPAPCIDPPSPTGLQASSATSVSHAAGEDCLSCHAADGSARPALLVAGTIYQDAMSRVHAAAGSKIEDVGQTTLTVDRCGNIYAVASFLNGALAASQPRAGMQTMSISTNQPTKRMGSCNAGGCHDFAEAWGVHY